MPEISIIIPIYNAESYLSECLDSVLAQTFDGFEAICVNDGSADKSGEILKQYASKDSRIKIITQENTGVISARNNGINMAVGKYIYPLDGDDKITPDCLELLYNSMISEKGDVIYSEVAFFGAKSGIKYLPSPTKLNMSKNNYVVCSALYKKSDWVKYDGYDENMKKGLEDWEFWCNFIYDNKKFYRIPKILFYYRQSHNTRSGSYGKKEQKELVKYVVKKHKLNGYILLRSIVNFFFQYKINKSGKNVLKIFKIPVLSMDSKLKKSNFK